MSQRFNEDNFIDAAKAYQRIQPPSGLREKVIEGAAASRNNELAGKASASQRSAVKTKSTRKIYKLASLAACIAVMVFSLQTWGPEGDFVDFFFGEGVPEASVIGIDQPADPADTSLPDEPGNMARIAEPVISEPVQTAELDAETAAYSPEPTDYAVMKRTIPVPAEEAATADAEEDQLNGLQEVHETTSEPVSVAAIFPTVLETETSLDDWEFRLVSAEEGSCTVEIMGGTGGASAVVTLLKNDENGQWEIKK